MVAWWTSPAYWKKHEEGKTRRALMGGGSHRQGSASFQIHVQKKVSKSIIYSSCQVIIFSILLFSITHPLFSHLQTLETGVVPEFFPFWNSFRERKGPPDPVVGTSLNMGGKQRKEAYVRKFKQKHGEDSDPYSAPFDAEVTHLDLVHFCSVVHLWRFSHTCCASTLLGCCDGGTREEEWSPIYWLRCY
jgi:hypothetical protein